MFRRTVVGLALAAALDDLTQPPYNYTISEATRALVWRTFEEGMAEGLRTIHKGHKAVITSGEPSAATAASSSSTSGTLIPLPATSTAAGKKTASSAENEANETTSSSNSITTLPALIDPSAQFPMYRYVDGMWTILLKDVDVKLKMPNKTCFVTTTTNSTTATAATTTGTTSNTTTTSRQTASEVTIHCDYLEVVAEGAAIKAQRALEDALRREQILQQASSGVVVGHTNSIVDGANPNVGGRGGKGVGRGRGAGRATGAGQKRTRN